VTPRTTLDALADVLSVTYPGLDVHPILHPTGRALCMDDGVTLLSFVLTADERPVYGLTVTTSYAQWRGTWPMKLETLSRNCDRLREMGRHALL
jgi:hypothetical protein